MNNYRFFDSSELVCKCCGKGEMDDTFMDKVVRARWESGFPFIVTSAYRCPDHDRAVGGEGNHPTGRAIDISGENVYQVMKIAWEMARAGVVRIGIDKRRLFVHGDCNLSHPYPWFWFY